MMKIWKYPLVVTDVNYIVIPKINRPLTVQMQDGIPCLWAIVDDQSPRHKVNVRTFGTGHDGITAEMEYIGTYQAGPLVFHVFIEPEKL